MSEAYEDKQDDEDEQNKSGILLPLLLLGLLGLGAGILLGRTREGRQKQGAGKRTREGKQEPEARIGAPGGVSSGADKILYLRLSRNEIQETDSAGAVLRDLWSGGPNEQPPDLLLDVAMQGHSRIELRATGSARTGTYLAIRRKVEQANIPLDEVQWPERAPSEPRPSKSLDRYKRQE
jgi:hypothetical protein